MQSDATARKRLAMRSHELRESVAHTKAELRQKRGLARRQRLQLQCEQRARELAETHGAVSHRELQTEADALRTRNVRSCPIAFAMRVA